LFSWVDSSFFDVLSVLPSSPDAENDDANDYEESTTATSSNNNDQGILAETAGTTT
jgi:hypothetical protein